MRKISTDDRDYFGGVRHIKILCREVLTGSIFENSNQFTFFNTNVLGIQAAFFHLKLNSGQELE